ncbi:MAG: hypothetical protein KJ749_08705 [Planctomycetes bacterium]|nr:hypothetical protein [Planctomycetota bacterium]
MEQPRGQLRKHGARLAFWIVLLILGVVCIWFWYHRPPTLPDSRPRPAALENTAIKAVFSVLMIAFGIANAWFYLRKPPGRLGSVESPKQDERPWRRVGAAIGLVVAVMFVLGIYIVDIPDYPRAYAAYWAVIMGLVIWMCVLGIRDALHTRQAIKRWQAKRHQADGAEPSRSPQ